MTIGRHILLIKEMEDRGIRVYIDPSISPLPSHKRDLDIEKILDLFKKGSSIYRISKDLSYTYFTVSKVVNQVKRQ